MENNKFLYISVVLKGPNYLLWARTTKSVLRSRGLWSHIEGPNSTSPQAVLEGKEKEGTSSKAADDNERWYQDDQTVLVLVQNSLDPAIHEAYSYCETAKELWETLTKVYGKISNITRVFEIQKALTNLSQEGLEFTKHFGKWRSLWAELEMLRPTTVDPKILGERREQDKVFNLLLTLDSTYSDLIKHMLRADKLPTLDEVCSHIHNEQGSLGLFGGKNELLMANKGAYKHEDKRTLVCDHCKKKGHIKDKCWLLHPHLKPAKFKDTPRAMITQEVTEDQEAPNTSGRELGTASHTSTQEGMLKKSDIEALLKLLRDSGITFLSHKSKDSFIVDSGASHHMISNSKLVNNVEPALGNVVVANGDKVPVRGIGTLKLFDKNTKAFLIPNFESNLLSVKRIACDLNCYVIFSPNDVKFQDIKTGKLIGEGILKDGLYILEDTKFISNISQALNSVCSLSSLVWHARLGHPHAKALKLMLPNMSFDNHSCEACILGKHCRTVFPKSETLYEKCFDLIHSDVWTSPCLSREKYKYFVTFIDEKSKYTWITLMPSKDKVFNAFTNFESYIANQFNAKVKVLRTDNGGEYMGQSFQTHLTKQGIIHQTSCPYTPQQNGVAERKNRHLMEVARSMMFHRNVPKSYWGDAVMISCYLINRIPTKILQDKSPFEVLNQVTPSIEHLRVFGCICYALVPGELRNKLEAQSKRCVFLGYSTTQKGYKCYSPEERRMYISRDVKFMEDKSYFDEKNWENLRDLSTSSTDRATNLRILFDHLGIDRPSDQRTRSQQNQKTSEANEEQDKATHLDNTHQIENTTQLDQNQIEEGVTHNQDQDHTSTTHDEEEEDDMVPPEPQPLRRSTRVRKDPSSVINTRFYFNNQAVAHPIQEVCSIDLLPANHIAFLVKIEENQVPQSYDEAKELKVWQDAVEDEVGAMERNHTWDEANLPLGKKAVSSKWVFTIKYHSNGNIERYKARLVARGFTQSYGEDYTDTFAPVAKLHTVRVVLSLATNLKWDLWQMDVKNAFLQGELEEEVYMTPPPGLENTISQGKVLRLRKAIYGLKQSPRAWYHKLSTTLKSRGFKKSEADHTLFTSCGPMGIIVVLIYVDDLIITGDNKDGIQATKSYLKSVFDMKDLGELKYFLGIEICRSLEGLFLSQRKYALDLLVETGKLGSKPARTPLEDGYKGARKGEKDDTPYGDAPRYRRLVGKLIYLTITRPDICFAVNQVSQHMNEPTVYHWSMVERILRYIKGSPGSGIWMGRNESTTLIGYCDADWAGDRQDRKSTTGYCTFLGGNLVTWKSKKQKVVSCSSAEAEYRAMRKLTDELIWLKALLQDLGVENDEPITMHCDNQAAIHIASNSVFHERTKHIEVDCHKVREKVEQGVILPCYTRSSDQLADIFTKAASSKVCEFINSKLGLINVSRQ